MAEDKQQAQVSVGAELKAARTKANLSIDDVQKQTKIQKKYLVAMENDDLEALPGKFYVRAFVRQFANAVGLSGDELVNRYQSTEQAPVQVDERVTPPRPETEQHGGSSTASRVKPAALKDQKNQQQRRHYLPLVGVVIIIIFVVGIVWVAVGQTRQENSNSIPSNSKVKVTNDNQKKKQRSQKVAKATNADTKVTLVPNSTSDFNVQVNNKSSELELAASQPTTATVMVDGKQAFQGNLAPNAGHNVELPIKTKTVNISMDNAPVSSIKLNDQQIVLPSPAAGTDATKRVMNLNFNK
ncbi:helix-turn-helix protein [Fructilactobacillus florum 8D]|uniref:Helix-turn-helix protein n=1 Tax=Fructilactobacillus florum 8D TaxID=1221538 RepID=W9EF82_9LACO|nr:helix-turn-helix domain-containing protein [Fructilactobacillus florum]EKK20903.1 helix-turn-helix protein [Fructilactobacillus florum 2F]ETO39886.1 helix-turn-helix protein [Fructilactobacillus florum 8D]